MRQRWPDVAIVLGAMALFVGLAWHQVLLPGLYYDEALDAWPALRVLQGVPQEFSRGAAIRIGDLALPVMVMEYVGPVNTYLTMASFSILGVGTESLRLVPILTSALTLPFVYLLGLRWFGTRWVAAGAVFLVAVSPSFVFWSRQGFHVTSVMSLFLYGGLVAWTLWWTTGRARWAVLGGLAFGLGLTAKFLFLWVLLAAPLAALLAGVAILGFRGLGKQLRVRLVPRTVMLALAAFLVGAAPLLVYNGMTGGTIDVILGNAAVTDQGIDNLAVGDNLGRRLGDLRAMLDGAGQFWFLGGIFPNPLPVWLAAIGTVMLALLPWLVSGLERLRWPAVFLPAFVALYVGASVVTVSGFGPTHYFMLLGMLQLLIAGGWWAGARALALAGGDRWTSRVAIAGATVALVLVFASDLQSTIRHHQALGETGGLRTHSDHIYDTAQWMVREGYTNVIALDWGIAKNLEIVSEGRIRAREIFLPGREVRPEFVELVRQNAGDTSIVWLVHAGDSVVFPREDAARQAVEDLGREFVEIDTVRQRDGTIVMRALRLLPRE